MRWHAVLGATLIGCGLPSMGLPQVIGDEAEMGRLERRAEESMASGDAEGAAMNMGKAALMAARLGRRAQPQAVTTLFAGLERLFRAEEHAYRALALFERAGGRPPASSSVCGTIRLAARDVSVSAELLQHPALAPLDSSQADKRDRYQRVASEWSELIAGLRADFECPK